MNVQLEYIDQTFAYYASIMELATYYAQNYAGIIGASLVYMYAVYVYVYSIHDHLMITYTLYINTIILI